MRVLITGGAGFIGYHLTKYLLAHDPDIEIVSIDNLNDYYDVELKHGRLADIGDWPEHRYQFRQRDIADKEAVDVLFNEFEFDAVINLAAQAGVRYSKIAPDTYMHSNVQGFYTLIDAAAKHGVKRFLYASSSSVYGSTKEMPFQETQPLHTPMSLYAATKVSNEALASSYFSTYGLEVVGMRFFNVFGAWGRPDMAYFKWTDAIYHGEEVEIRNNGELYRDMTYVEDVVTAVEKLLTVPDFPHQPLTVNIGNSSPVKIKDVLDFIISEMKNRGLSADYTEVFTEKGPEEPEKTWANTDLLRSIIEYAPHTGHEEGLRKFIDWYEGYYVKT